MTKAYTPAKHAIIYSRVSSINQDFHSSGEHQYSVCEKYCQNKGLSILGAYGMIETAYKRRRPGFESILGCLEQHHGEPVALVVTSVDRLLRSFCFLDRLNKLREEGRLELHFIEEKLLLSANSTPNEICSFKKVVAEAEEYSAWISYKTKLTFQNLRERGIYPGKAPIGYSNIHLDSCKSIEPDEQAGKVQLLFVAFLQPKVGISELLKVAQSIKLKTTTGALISRKPLIHMLKNPFYYGKMKSGGRLYWHQYESLVSEEVFMAVQNKLLRELYHLEDCETKMKFAA